MNPVEARTFQDSSVASGVGAPRGFRRGVGLFEKCWQRRHGVLLTSGPVWASNHFQRPQLGAARCRVARTLFVPGLHGMFGKDPNPPRLSQRLELFLYGPVIAGNETDPHHSPAALQ